MLHAEEQPSNAPQATTVSKQPEHPSAPIRQRKSKLSPLGSALHSIEDRMPPDSRSHQYLDERWPLHAEPKVSPSSNLFGRRHQKNKSGSHRRPFAPRPLHRSLQQALLPHLTTYSQSISTVTSSRPTNTSISPIQPPIQHTPPPLEYLSRPISSPLSKPRNHTLPILPDTSAATDRAWTTVVGLSFSKEPPRASWDSHPATLCAGGAAPVFCERRKGKEDGGMEG